MDMNQIMKQMESMKKQFMEAQDNQKGKEFEGNALGGKVSITISYVTVGNYKVTKVNIDPSLVVVDEVDILEDLIMAAFNDAIKKAGADSENAFASLMPPGFKLPF